MKPLTGDVIDPTDDIEFIKRLEKEGYIGPQTAEKRKDSAYEQLKQMAGSSKASNDYFLNIREGLDALVTIQYQINWRFRVEKTPALYAGEQAIVAVKTRISGEDRAPATIDDLFDHQLEVIKAINLSISDGIIHSTDLRDRLVDYRDNRVLDFRQRSIAAYTALEKKAADTVELTKQTEQRLARTRLTDPNYTPLYKAHGVLQRNIQALMNEMEKCDRTTTYRTRELDQVTKLLETVDGTVLALDGVNQFIVDVVENIENTRDAYRFLRNGFIQIEAAYAAFAILSDSVILGARDMGDLVGRVARASKTQRLEALPEMLGRMVSNYNDTISDANMKKREALAKSAATIRNSYGFS